MDPEAMRDLLAPQMRKLADQGIPEAVIWMATNFHEEAGRVQALEKLASTGDANALLALALHKYSTDKEQSNELLKKAADAGNPLAMLFVARKPEDYQR